MAGEESLPTKRSQGRISRLPSVAGILLSTALNLCEGIGGTRSESEVAIDPQLAFKSGGDCKSINFEAMAATVVGYRAVLGDGDFSTALWTALGAWGKLGSGCLAPVTDASTRARGRKKNLKKNCQCKAGRRSMNFLANI